MLDSIDVIESLGQRYEIHLKADEILNSESQKQISEDFLGLELKRPLSMLILNDDPLKSISTIMNLLKEAGNGWKFPLILKKN